jgi:hypothetical protein
VPHSISAPLSVVLSLGALLSAAAVARGGGRLRMVQAGALAGLVTLTRPEFAAAILSALALWLALRWLRAGPGVRGRVLMDALVCAVSASVLPLVVYGAFAGQIGVGTLVHDNLVPRDQLAAGSNAVLKASAPLTAASFVELALHALAYGALMAAAVAATMVAARGQRTRRVVAAAVGLVLVIGVAVLLVRPEAVRSRLDLAYAWIPAGAAAGAFALAIRARLSRPWEARDQVALLCVTFLAVLAAKTYAAFAPYPNPDFAQFATYAMPFAAIAVCWLHLEILPAGRADLRAIGLAWLGLLTAASVLLVSHDARRESFTVRGPGGALRTTPAQGKPLQAAIDRIVRDTRRGEPVLMAPQLTALYTLSGRMDPLPQISLLPGALATASDEEAAIRRMDDVRLAVVDRRKLVEYDQGSFGESFDRRLGAWLRGEFRRTATFRGVGAGALTLDIWKRTTP